MRFVYAILLWLCSNVISAAHGFYLPGVNPQTFLPGDNIPVKINKLASANSFYPMDYYRLPFCAPSNGPTMKVQTTGQFLSGDRIKTSPYQIIAGKELYCQQLCISNLGTLNKQQSYDSKIIKAIKLNYHHNWIIDNLPSAYQSNQNDAVNNNNNTTTTAQTTVQYTHGFPIGYIDTKTQTPYIYNHVNIHLEYHHPGYHPDGMRIVRFTVEPMSIAHNFTIISNINGSPLTGPWATIHNPIPSCILTNKNNEQSKTHTSYEMVNNNNNDYETFPQPASGLVLFTYDVIWKLNNNVQWSNRWDVYLIMDNSIPNQLHWIPIFNSIIGIIILSMLILVLVIRSVRNELAQQNPFIKQEGEEGAKVIADNKDNNILMVKDLEVEEEEQEKKGWKLLHADVFRPPEHPMMLCVLCGTGVQLLGMSFGTMILSIFGFVNPSRRGSLWNTLILYYCIMGIVAGYIMARLYKSLRGKEQRKATLYTAIGFPGLCFVCFILHHIIAIWNQSTLAVPFLIIIKLLFWWFGVSIPLIYLGATIGHKHKALEFPMATSIVPRKVPNQPWYMNERLMIPIVGLIPLASCSMEFYFILNALWKNECYYVFGILYIIFCIVLILCAEITLLCTFAQLCHEDYHWWWRCSFGTTSISLSIYILVYSVAYFQQHVEAKSISDHLFYFGFMSLVSLGIGLMVGCIGLFTSLWFTCKLYGCLQVE